MSNRTFMALAGAIALLAVVTIAILGGIGGSPTGGPGAGSEQWDAKKAKAELARLDEEYENTRQNADMKRMAAKYRRLVERYPRFAEARARYAMALYDARNWEEAYEQVKISLELNARQADIELLAGTIASNLGLVEQAEGHYSQAVGLDPDNASFLTHLAQAMIAQSGRDPAKFEQARHRLLEALRYDSESHAAYGLLADLYARQNKMDLALTQIEKAVDATPLELRPIQVEYLKRKAHYLRRTNRPEQALQVLNQLLLPEEAARADVIEDLAVTWAMLGDKARGAELYEEQLAALPTEIPLIVGAAHWRIKAGDYDAAMKHIRTLREINPRHPAIEQLQRLAETQRARNDEPESREPRSGPSPTES